MFAVKSVLSAIDKFRVWGVPGVISFFVREINYRRQRRWLWKLAKESKCEHPVRGITVVGNITGQASIDKVLRDFVLTLKAVGIPCQTCDITSKPQIPEKDAKGVITPAADFDLRRYSHVIVMYRSPVEQAMVPECRLARIVFHDSEHGIHDTMPYIRESGDDILAFSDFNFNYFKRAFPDQKVFKIIYPLLLADKSGAMPRNELRKKYGIGEDDFVVFYNFDFGSYYRKNPLAAIEAFAKAFADVPNAKLMFKTKGAKDGSKPLDEVNALVKKLNLESRFIHIRRYLPRAEVDGLTGACDVYLSLHKSEGFGIGMAEAMSQQKPVVATNWSANTEFCRPDTAYCVPYSLTPILPHEYPVSMKEWADADVDAAARMLREVHDDPQNAAKRAAEGQRFLLAHFASENFKKSVELFLDCTAGRT